MLSVAVVACSAVLHAWQVRETITAARAAAKSPKPHIQKQLAGTASLQVKQQAAAIRDSPLPDNALSQFSPQPPQQQSRAVSGQQSTSSRTAWSQLPAEEAAAKMAAAAARYKAMAAIMTPEQQELEEK